jgi:hypothetical protein
MKNKKSGSTAALVLSIGYLATMLYAFGGSLLTYLRVHAVWAFLSVLSALFALTAASVLFSIILIKSSKKLLVLPCCFKLAAVLLQIAQIATLYFAHGNPPALLSGIALNLFFIAVLIFVLIQSAGGLKRTRPVLIVLLIYAVLYTIQQIVSIISAFRSLGGSIPFLLSLSMLLPLFISFANTLILYIAFSPGRVFVPSGLPSRMTSPPPLRPVVPVPQWIAGPDAQQEIPGRNDADLIQKLETLSSLRAQGLITEEEYETKRKELLARF